MSVFEFESKKAEPQYLHGATKGTAAYTVAVEFQAALDKLNELNAENSVFEDEIEELDNELNKIRAQFAVVADKVQTRKKEIEAERLDLRRAINQQRREIDRLRRLLDIAIAEEMRKGEFIANALKFDEITAGFSWREWALQHQIDGAKVLANSRSAILGDGMGLGKTLTSMIYMDMLEAQKILVVAPDDVVSNFDREIKRWAPHRTWATLSHLPAPVRGVMLKSLAKTDEYIVTINYSAWRKDKGLIASLKELRFDTVVLDEAHSIKNVQTAAYKGCAEIVLAKNICPRCSEPLIMDDYRQYCTDTEVCKFDTHDWEQSRDESGNYYDDSKYRSVTNVLPMTGTVILNKPQDLFALLSLIDPKNFSQERNFLSMYCEQDYFTNKWKFGQGGLQKLIEKLGSRYVARDRHTAGVILPVQEVKIHEFDLDKQRYAKQAEVINQLTKHAQIALEGHGVVPILYTISLILRKRQANVWPAGIQFKDLEGNVVFSVGDEVQESAKIDMLIDNTCDPESDEDCSEGLIPEMVLNGERVVVFSQFKQPLKEIVKRLKDKGITAIAFDGDTVTSRREEIKKDFDRKYCDEEGYVTKWDVVCCNFKTGGVGLNFTGATQTIILDEEWNPGKNEQAWGRTDRVGQTEESQVHILRMRSTVDDWMAALIDEKKEMISGFESEASGANAILDALRNGEF